MKLRTSSKLQDYSILETPINFSNNFTKPTTCCSWVISILNSPHVSVLDSIVVSIPACHAGDRGSIPRRGDYFCIECVFFLHIQADWPNEIINVTILSSIFKSAEQNDCISCGIRTFCNSVDINYFKKSASHIIKIYECRIAIVYTCARYMQYLNLTIFWGARKLFVRSGIRTHAYRCRLRPERSALDHSAILTIGSSVLSIEPDSQMR